MLTVAELLPQPLNSTNRLACVGEVAGTLFRPDVDRNPDGAPVRVPSKGTSSASPALSGAPSVSVMVAAALPLVSVVAGGADRGAGCEGAACWARARNAATVPVPNVSVSASICSSLSLSSTTAAVQLGELDRAAAMLTPVLALPAERRISWLRKRVTRVDELLGADRFAGSDEADALRTAVTACA